MATEKNQDLAIIGMGCRFPGNAHNPKAFWEMLCQGEDGVVEVPKTRWSLQRFYNPNPEQIGKTHVKHGGYLQQRIDEFDALFFGISPREAETLDPQQRLLLEVAWEALEDAGLVASQLAGTDTGVFIGGFMMDHLSSQTSLLNRHLINTHSAVSFSQTLLSARLAYTFDLQGPCFSMDTACSSSLVAMHQACQAIWRGECQQALVGGVNVMYRPETLITMVKGQFLAADGRSKSFDVRADGYGRGEGAGLVVIKPLAQAQKDGDLIYASIVGTGINQDGHTDGITVPNPKAQARLIRSVLNKAKVKAEDIAYVEAHGTGTAIGDPLECQALGESLQASRQAPCWVGSVKANIGHLESAAGIAGVIKTALCLAHKQIPPVANLQTPNPRIAFSELGLRLPRRLENFSADSPYAGINSFGYGGTNAHAILKHVHTQQKNSIDSPDEFYSLPISARSEKALQALAQRYQTLLTDEDLSLQDICYSAATRREHHRYRLVLQAKTRLDLQQQLNQFIEGKGTHLPQGKASPKKRKAVFVLTGMGPQWWAMGQNLYQQEPVFRDMVQRCDNLFKQIAGWSIFAEMNKPESESRMAETQIAQPANFVLQVSLAALWRAKGIEPAAIVGHSVGDVSASYLSGVLSLEDALLVSYQRGRLQQSQAGQGKMLAVGLSAEKASAYVERFGNKVDFAAINGVASVTLSGDAEALEQIAAELEAQEIFNRFLRVELAYHSTVMEAIKDELLNALEGIKPGLPKIDLYSTVTGKKVETVLYDAPYWYQNVRQPVLFADSIRSLARQGHDLFLEIGPHPVLAVAIKEVMSAEKVHADVVASLRRELDEQSLFYQAWGNLYCLGATPDWQTCYPDGGQFVRLPLYPWQRSHYWHESQAAIIDRCGHEGDHPLLGHRANAPTPTWQQPLNNQYLPWLPEHQVQSLVVLPGAAYVEIGLQIQQQIQKNKHIRLEQLQFKRALVINDLDEPELHNDYSADDQSFRIYSRRRDGQEWTLHAQGQVQGLEALPSVQVDLAQLQAQCPNALAIDVLYAQLGSRNLHYGNEFRTIKHAWRGEQEILVQLVAQAPLEGYALHPTLLDGAFQSLIGLLDGGDERSFVPVAIEKLDFYASPSSTLWAHSMITQQDEHSLLADIGVYDEQGVCIVKINNLRCQAINEQKPKRHVEDWLYQVDWQAKALAPVETPLKGNWLVFMDQQGLSDALIPKLAVGQVIRVYPGDSFKKISPSEFHIRPQQEGDMKNLIQGLNTQALSGVLFAWALDLVPAQDEDGTLMSTALLYCARQCMAINQDNLHFFVLSIGAQSLAQTPAINAAQASVVGLSRVISNEYTLRCKSIDLEDSQDPAIHQALINELLAQDEEPEVALYQQQRLVYRVNRWHSQQSSSISLSLDDYFQLQAGEKHNYWQQTQAADVAANEIELQIDHLILPKAFQLAKAQTLMVAGHIKRSQHSDFSPQQKLLVLAPVSSLSSHLCLDVKQAEIIPLAAEQSLSSLEQVQISACLPAFSQAAYCLQTLLPLQKQQRLFIHASEDDFDLACAQLALQSGCDVSASYHSERKKQALATLGIQQLYALEDKQTIAAELDVIISTRVDEFIKQSLSQLKPFARLLLVDTQIDHVSLQQLKNIQILQFDSQDFAQQHKAHYQQSLAQTLARLQQGQLSPAPIEVFDLKHHEQALQATAQHSVAIQMSTTATIEAQALPQALALQQGSYLITGGFGGFGLKLAAWLVKQGVKQLILVGRRGAASDDAKRTLALLKQSGAQIEEAKVDITQAEQVQDLIKHIQQHCLPLVGVFHTAAVLDDAMLNDLSAERLAAVMLPKAKGAWYLHQATKDLNLAYFVLFSSISALVGKPGQSNYVAANAYLDQLAHYRRAQGLHGLSLNWGVLSEVGMAARQNVEARLQRMGIGSFNPDEAMQLLALSLQSQQGQLGLMNIDWQAFWQTNSNRNVALRYADLLEPEWLITTSPLQQLYDELKGREFEERQHYLQNLLRTWITDIMRLPADNLELDMSLNHFGLDSLMAVEVQGKIESQTGVSLSVLEVMQDNSIEQLSDKLLSRLQAQL